MIDDGLWNERTKIIIKNYRFCAVELHPSFAITQ
jgi:hypothetical protein